MSDAFPHSLLLVILSITTVELTFLARPIKKITEVLDLEQNTAYGMIHKQGNASLELAYDSIYYVSPLQ